MSNKIDLIGQKFGRLLVIEADSPPFIKRDKTWKCICECGAIKNITTSNLTSGSTKSCGCLQREIAILRLPNMQANNIRFAPDVASSRKVYQMHYNDGDLTFDDFIAISQQNCFYCNDSPSNLSSIPNRNNSEFEYNGLDRLDSSKSHNKDNVVPCCKYCNFAKNNLTIIEFAAHIVSMHIYRNSKWCGNYYEISVPAITNIKIDYDTSSKDRSIDIIEIGMTVGKLTVIGIAPATVYGGAGSERSYNTWICRCACGIEKPIIEASLCRGLTRSCGAKECKRKNTPFLMAMRTAWRNRYNFDGLPFESFLELSQNDCYYCGKGPMNLSRCASNDMAFKYNGLDRIDSNQGHIIGNIIPCCAICNKMKRERTINEFDIWLTKVYNTFID